MAAFFDFSPADSLINIFIGNLDYSATEEQLRAAFSVYGPVDSCTIVVDRDTGKSRGFAFIEMANSEQAQTAIVALDGSLLGDRAIRVNEARPKADHNRHSNGLRGRDHRRHRI
jgi:RNA recognition motif-containing protein